MVPEPWISWQSKSTHLVISCEEVRFVSTGSWEGGAEAQPRYSHNQMSHEVILNIALFLLPPLYRSLNVIIIRGATPRTPHLKGQPANFSQALSTTTRNILPYRMTANSCLKMPNCVVGPTYLKTKMTFALKFITDCWETKMFLLYESCVCYVDQGCYSYNVDLSSRGSNPVILTVFVTVTSGLFSHGHPSIWPNLTSLFRFMTPI
jgi:hypothetical protein